MRWVRLASRHAHLGPTDAASSRETRPMELCGLRNARRVWMQRRLTRPGTPRSQAHPVEPKPPRRSLRIKQRAHSRVHILVYDNVCHRANAHKFIAQKKSTSRSEGSCRAGERSCRSATKANFYTLFWFFSSTNVSLFSLFSF